MLTIEVPAEAGALMHWLHGNTEVLDRQTNEDGSDGLSHPRRRGPARPACRTDEAGRARAAGLSAWAPDRSRPWPRSTDASISLQVDCAGD